MNSFKKPVALCKGKHTVLFQFGCGVRGKTQRNLGL